MKKKVFLLASILLLGSLGGASLREVNAEEKNQPIERENALFEPLSDETFDEEGCAMVEFIDNENGNNLNEIYEEKTISTSSLPTLPITNNRVFVGWAENSDGSCLITGETYEFVYAYNNFYAVWRDYNELESFQYESKIDAVRLTFGYTKHTDDEEKITYSNFNNVGVQFVVNYDYSNIESVADTFETGILFTKEDTISSYKTLKMNVITFDASHKDQYAFAKNGKIDSTFIADVINIPSSAYDTDIYAMPYLLIGYDIYFGTCTSASVSDLLLEYSTSTDSAVTAEMKAICNAFVDSL